MRRRNSIITSAFVKSLYNEIVGFPYGVPHVVSVRSLAFACHRWRYFKSAHFAIRVAARYRKIIKNIIKRRRCLKINSSIIKKGFRDLKKT